MTEREYLALLYSFILFGPVRINLLTSYFKSSKNVWKASGQELLKLGLRPDTVEKFNRYRNKIDPINYFKRLKSNSVHFVTYLDKRYPKNLKNLDDAPCVLYLKGKLKKSDENAIAIVGARKMTAYGKEVTTKFAGELAGLGITIISGLARGVDTKAHNTVLEVGGRTIAVLAGGLDNIYPPENSSLAKNIVDSGGVLLSEYPLGYPSYRGNFVNRNRIISGLSKAVLVIEGEKRSGTLLTASHAANQGRQVFAVPGPISSPTSGAPLFLIQNGAKAVTCTKDILEELDF
ncbi:DNA protecting protein DprA [Candidatus Woesebacteria bacterium RBG_16_36_11]|uniref:DNA protecting protein DprA n=3 Tax=Candidatus Woeseibacteriota TaxID=1752722 RepID=A0A1F7XBW5_9BACT|nr:MAG: DNA protecting protein DprA [Candidatus Woesebacteria bacterium RBG_13_36_22]OGM12453.1 MAG: DNA protecting protein DprA [Candidatus Woesebacteria bacterium RBG_16_36_11]OGM15632.1 MAG: DNA protecting protein DprA [Candidatus Woesebacteria bacterium RBG_19FT_COMBO_37_29]